MNKSTFSMIPGPVQVPSSIYNILSNDYGSGKYEHELFPLYFETGKLLAQCMSTSNDVVIMSGEGMLALWAGLKSCLKPGDKVLAIANGIFGEGIGQMAASLGCQVKTLTYPFNTTLNELNDVEAAIADFKPHMITAVHCETPSGTLNPLHGLGALKKKYAVPLFYVDAISSIGGAPVLMDDWNIDLLLGAPQKCLSAPPSLCFLGLSPMAWDVICKVNYQGYDALSPWNNLINLGYFPYTPYWEAIAALNQAAKNLLTEGLENVFERHSQVADLCRKSLKNLGIQLWAAEDATASPTVTTAHIPNGHSWQSWQQSLQKQGLIVGGGLGELHGKVFRIGHMGIQAEKKLVQQALKIIEKNIAEKK